MLYLLFMIGIIWLGWKLVVLAVKATWGLTKILFYIIFCPLLLFGLVVCGFVYVALLVLLVGGGIALLCGE